MPTDRSGDNPVDDLDDGRGTHRPTPGRQSDFNEKPAPGTDAQDVHSTGDNSGVRQAGPDLVRAALRAAQASTAARRAQPASSASASGPASGPASTTEPAAPPAELPGALPTALPPAGSSRRRRSGGRPRRRGYSGAGPDERDPQPLGRAASRLVTDRRWADRLARGRLFARWPELVGPEIAAHVHPEALRDGELTVRTDTTAWATQLRALQRQLLERIAAGVGPQVVRRLRVLAPVAPSWKHGLRSVRGRGPRDTYG